VSSIADKFKKFLPVNGNNVSVSADSAAALTLENVDTLQTSEEKTVLIRRDAAPEPTGLPADTDAADAAAAAQAPEQAVQAEASSPAAGSARATRTRRSQRSNPARQQRILAMALAGVVLLLLLVAGSAILRAERLAQQVAATGQSLMQSQRLAKSVSQALVGTGFGYAVERRAREGEIAARVLSVARDLRRIGSAALDLAWTACGRLDAFYERGLNPWDAAAGMLICARAGLEVRALPAAEGLPAGVLVAPASIADDLEAVVRPSGR